MPSSAFRARPRIIIAGTVGAFLLVGGTVTAAQAAPLPATVTAPLGVCTPDGGFPYIDGTTPAQPQVHDTGVNTYAGGDFIVAGGAAEAEGLVVVAGDAVIGKDFIVGIAIGSDVRPAPGETMLQVGGDVDVASGSVLRVGDFAIPGGAVAIGGTATAGGISNAGADLQTGLGAADALDPYAAFSAQVSSWSSSLATQNANGTVTASTGWVVLDMAGTGTDELQVFDVTAEQLSAADEIRFSGIAPYAPVLVNVVGGPVAVTASTYFYNGAVLTMSSPNDGNIAASILWNYQDAAAVEIGGTGQVPGSILAPSADVDIVANTNGRVYVGGDLTTRGQGNELHAYPWAGTCVDDGEGDADADADADGSGADADADGSGADADGAGADADGAGADADTDGTDADAGGADAGADGAGADADGADAGADGTGADAAADGSGADADADAAGADADAGPEGSAADTSADGTGAAAEATASGSTEVVTDATTSDDSSDALATTGGTVSLLVLVTATVLLAAGGVLAARRRRV